MKILEQINHFIWGLPVLSMILFAGIFLTFKTNFAQIRMFPAAVTHFCSSLRKQKNPGNEVTGYRALCTALAATVGTGNIAGVAGAIAIGGPGVIFWMWLCGILGMIIKFTEVILALHYRKKDSSGQYLGGPMYIIENGLPPKFRFLAFYYCLFGLVATFGVGNGTQINAVVDSVKKLAQYNNFTLKLPHLLLLGVILACTVTLAFRKGTSGIASWAEKLVPFASIFYILLATSVLILRFQEIPKAIYRIFKGAFTPGAVTGGVIGSIFVTLRVGVSRGIFTNEAGMGTASVAHASAKVDNIVVQGFLGMIEVFLDTIVLCTLTALVILCSGVSVTYHSDPGILLTLEAFSHVLGDWISVVITALVCIFAFATVLGWGFYGLRFMEYLFGSGSWHIFILMEGVVCFISVLADTSLIWILSEIFNGLMAIPNLIVLIWLMPVVLSHIKEYKKAYRS